MHDCVDHLPNTTTWDETVHQKTLNVWSIAFKIMFGRVLKMGYATPVHSKRIVTFSYGKWALIYVYMYIYIYIHMIYTMYLYIYNIINIYININQYFYKLI